MAKVTTMLDPSQMPTNGRWYWKEETSTLEYVSNNPAADKADRRRDGRRQAKGIHFQDTGTKRNDRGTTPAGKGGAYGRKQAASKSSKKQPVAEHTNVTLEDVKGVARGKLTEIEDYPSTFEAIFETRQFDHFLLCLLNYFHWFFEKKAQDEKPNPMNIEPSAKEKEHYAEFCTKLESAQKLLGHSYCVLVLGTGLEKQHHMVCGRKRVSSTYKDRGMYETLYQFCSYMVWIAFKRREYDIVRKEVGRMLRSDTFNPAIRIKNAPDQETAEDDGEKKEKGEEQKLTPAEYRRLQGKRPAIKSIINQRSPALVSILPSPKEEAHWLFKRTGGLSPTSLAAIGKEDIDEETSLEHLDMDFSKLKVGIIGEPLSQFNPVTLTPAGAENEEETEENDPDKPPNSRRESAVPGTHTKTPQSQDLGLSRQTTALSHATTEALQSDGED